MNRNDLTPQIIGAAIEVHKLLGPGLLESAYEECLCHELAMRGIHFEKQKPVPNLQGHETRVRIPPVLTCRRSSCCRTKSVDGLGPIHEAIMLPYLRLSGHPLGLLINFNVSVLKDGVRRFIMPPDPKQPAFSTESAESTE